MAKVDLTPVKEWVDSKEKDYDAGMLLLAKCGHNRFLQQSLARKKRPEKLEYELKKILMLNGPNPANASKLPNPDATLQTNPPDQPLDDKRWKIERGGKIVKEEELPDALKPVYKDAVTKYKKLRSLHEKLKLSSDESDEKREPIAKEMRKLDDEIRACWDKIDAWDGKEIKEPSNNTGDDIVKKVTNARTYISRNKKALADPKKKDKLLPKIQERVNVLLASKADLDEKTVVELKKLGVVFS